MNVKASWLAMTIAVAGALSWMKTSAAPLWATQASAARTEQTYDGNWWLNTSQGERRSFIEGAGDCLQSKAHRSIPFGSPYTSEPAITKYYEDHSAERSREVWEVWRLVAPKEPIQRPPGGHPEIWTGPHGYYDGEFWAEGSREEQIGFVEGYLWCMRKKVKTPQQTYSRSADYYADKISEFVKAHRSYDKPIASILERYRDKGKPASLVQQ